MGFGLGSPGRAVISLTASWMKSAIFLVHDLRRMSGWNGSPDWGMLDCMNAMLVRCSTGCYELMLEISGPTRMAAFIASFSPD